MQASTAEYVRVEGAPPFIIRPAEPGDLARVMAFWGGPGLHHVCFEPGQHPSSPSAAPVPGAFIATDAGDQVAGLGWVEGSGEPGCGRLSLTVHAAYRHHEVLPRLLHRVASEARERGIQRLVTAVLRETSDPFPLFAGAGLTTTSSLGFGGMAEVVLELH